MFSREVQFTERFNLQRSMRECVSLSINLQDSMRECVNLPIFKLSLNRKIMSTKKNYCKTIRS